MDPHRAIALLDQLEPLGFTDAAFGLLHHFGPDNPKSKILEHRRYINRPIQNFREDSPNFDVQRRLELVLNAYQKGGFQSRKPEIFVDLARAALHEIPVKTTQTDAV